MSSGAIAEGHAAPRLDAAPARDARAAGRGRRRPDGPRAVLRDLLSRARPATAQVLLTHADLADRQRYLNARSTLRTLLALGVIPVINENDTVVTDEIKLRRQRHARRAGHQPDRGRCLIILTDQAGLYDRRSAQGTRRATCSRSATRATRAWRTMAGGSGQRIASGGMLTKVLAAKRAARSGAHTVIASGHEPDVLLRLAAGSSSVC